MQAASPDTSPAADLRGEVFEGLALHGNMKFLEIDKKEASRWAFALIAAAFVIFTLGGFFANKSRKPAPIGPFSAITSPGNQPGVIKIQVEGEVKNPGVYDLQPGSRIQDAIDKAGGPLPDADLSDLNLADWATDGSKIEVHAHRSPTPATVSSLPSVTAPPLVPSVTAVPLPATGPAPGSSTSGGPTAAPDSKSSDIYLEHLRQNPVNLNTAAQADLETLPGVGPKMATRILEYRQQNGGFKTTQELDNIPGIGAKRLEALRQFVVVQ